MLVLRKFLLLSLLLSSSVMAQQIAASKQLEVFKSPYCGCCTKWIDHMRANGFEVLAHNVRDVPAERERLGMPHELGSCHTAKVGGYLIEGHVPAADVKRLLSERPQALGLSVPSMPQGSPGMESPHPEPYETLLVNHDGSTSVFARH